VVGVERQGDLASCGSHGNTGSSTVLANGKGITRAGLDSVAGAPIIGGVPSVLVEGFPVSKPGDLCAHPDVSPHTNATTANPSSDVRVLETVLGYISAEVGVAAFTLMSPAGGVVPVGQDWVGPNVFDFIITNLGPVATPPFSIGIFEITPNKNGELELPEDLVTLRRGSTSIDGISLVWEMDNIILPPVGNLKGSDIGFANFTSLVPANSKRYYILALDIDLEISTELIAENNMSFPFIPSPFISTGA